MESNFIKERVVVREQIIKERNPGIPAKSNKTPKVLADDKIREKVLKYEEFINDKLKRDLKEVTERMESICQVIAEYLQIKATIKAIKHRPRNLRLQTDLGCNFYVQCSVPDASKIFLNVGQDYFLHLELDEAEKMIDFKEKQLQKRLNECQEKAANIKAYIKIVLEALGEVQDLK